MKLYKFKNRGTITEAWKTKKEISANELDNILPKYHLYGYDNRLNAVRFIANDMQKEEYSWIAIVIEKIEI
jgi:hypothetical protein